MAINLNENQFANKALLRSQSQSFNATSAMAARTNAISVRFTIMSSPNVKRFTTTATSQ